MDASPRELTGNFSGHPIDNLGCHKIAPKLARLDRLSAFDVDGNGTPVLLLYSPPKAE